jgi:hypothetical protein
MHIEELHNIIVMIKVGHVVCMGEIELYTILVRSCEWKRLLGTPRQRLEDISGSDENRV